MTTSATTVNTSGSYKVKVISIPSVDASGNVHYTTTYDPEIIYVTEEDTVISYHLVAPTPAAVKFVGMSVSPDHSHQFSHPSISHSGKVLTTIDADTLAETLNLTLYFSDADGVGFKDDPEVVNELPPM